MVLAAVFVGLYYGGIIPDFLNLNKETTAPQVSNSQVSTTEANRFEGIITVKGTYLFFEGKEIKKIHIAPIAIYTETQHTV